MSEATPIETPQSGPSLEDILWRAVDRWTEDPALLDVEEFAARIQDTFFGETVTEEWIERFFRGGEDALHAPARDMAEAVVRAARDRMFVYQFDLNELEYVIIEDKDQVVIVSDFGQFAIDADDTVTRALEAGGELLDVEERRVLRPAIHRPPEDVLQRGAAAR